MSSGTPLNVIEKHLFRIVRMTSLEELWSLHLDCMDSYGFDRVLYASTRFRTAYSSGDLRDALVLTNYPDNYCKDYLDGGLYRDSPMVRWGMENVGSRSWREIGEDMAAGRLSEGELKVCAFNAKHGITSGYGISFPRTSSRAGFGIGLASTTMAQADIDAMWAEKGDEIELINHVTHLTICSLPTPAHNRPLTARQREVLELVADGKTVQDVALMLDRNPATVEKHLRLAREALEVETTAQAILKASVQNQFFRYEA